MKKSLIKPGTVASLTARGGPAVFEESPGPWLGKTVAERLEHGRSLLVDLATDLPFDTVLRGRVPPPKEPVLKAAEPLAQVLQQFGGRLPMVPIDAGYVQQRYAVIERLGAFEQSCENFLGLLRRARAVLSSQLEKAMRQAFALADEAAPSVEGLQKALDPLRPVLGFSDKK